MPYQIEWLLEKRVLHVKLFGILADEDSAQIGVINSRHLQEGTAPVHILVDITGLDKFPISLRQNSQYMDYLKSPALGWVIVVGLSNNMLAKFAVSVISQVIKFHLAQRDSLPDALAYLASHDPSLKLDATGMLQTS